jgi:NTP pyrophosphatase (non-canonical NTP hydrolase)
MLQNYKNNKGVSEIDLNDRLLYCVKHELNSARNKFPTNQFLLAALVEEVGELSQSLIDHEFDKKTKVEIYEEAIQVAAMALRIAQEGSAEFKYQPDYECYRDWNSTD